MIRRLIFAFGIVAAASAVTGLLYAGEPDAGSSAASTSAQATVPPKSKAGTPETGSAAPAPATAEAEALHKALSSLVAGDSDEERNEHEALVSFYEARGYAPLWLTPAGGLTP